MVTQDRNSPRCGPAQWRTARKGIPRETLTDHYILWESDDPIPDDQARTTEAYHTVMKEIAAGDGHISKWTEYVRQLAQIFSAYDVKRDIKLQPGMCALLTLQEGKLGELIAKKTIHLYHSLLGPYFTIFGVDEVYYHNGYHVTLQFDPVITAAPIEEYGQVFTQLLNYHQTHFKASLFMPFEIARLQYPGLRTGWSTHQGDNCWLEALFTNIDFGQYSFRGDLSFGTDEWLDTPPNGGSWTAYPPE